MFRDALDTLVTYKDFQPEKFSVHEEYEPSSKLEVKFAVIKGKSSLTRVSNKIYTYLYKRKPKH